MNENSARIALFLSSQMNNLFVGAVLMTNAKIFELFSISTSSHFRTDLMLFGHGPPCLTNSAKPRGVVY
jgi:hypothetical protein